MPAVKLDLKNLSTLEKVALARRLTSTLTGNAAFANPVPPLADISTATNALETAAAEVQSALQTVQVKGDARKAAEKNLDGLLTRLANWVEAVTGGDAAKINAAGMDVRSAGGGGARVGDLPGVTSLQASVGDNDGEIDLDWDSVRGASAYQIEQGTSGDGPWQSVKTVTPSKATIESLTSGTKYWFRVAAVGPNGPGPWSDPATKAAG